MHVGQYLTSIVLWIVLCFQTWNTSTRGESLTCLAVYKEGGAPAVFQSPKCPRWKLSTEYGSHKSQPLSPSARCQLAMHQGRRQSQEDRILCALDIRIPFPGLSGLREVKAGIVAVFDGHNGLEASEMASKLLLEYFMLHIYFLLDSTFSLLSRRGIASLPNEQGQNLFHQNIKWDKQQGQYALDLEWFKLSLSADSGISFHLEILREALLSAIRDIDATFSREAFRKKFDSGSTATVILMADDQILVANVGDSKAFLCSEVSLSPAKVKDTLSRLIRQKRNEGAFPSLKDSRSIKRAVSSRRSFFMAKELTRDHHPDRDDERARVETAGGHVSEWGGVARVNGQLAVSRAIGDVHFKSYGVISVPEVTDWRPLTDNDSYLVVASDGIFETISPQDVCELLWVSHDLPTGSEETSSSCYSLADCIVKSALARGSMDNMAVAIISFSSSNALQTPLVQRYDRLGRVDSSALGRLGGILEDSAYKNTSEVIEMEDAHPVIGNLDRLMVEGDVSNFGCFYLSENLNENDDYSSSNHKDGLEYRYDLHTALPDAVAQRYGASINLYGYQHMCMQLPMKSDGDKDHCINPEKFARFLSLIESIPLYRTGPFEQTIPDSRYKLKKRYDRGAYGEVWLAFHWNCSHVTKDLQWNLRYKNFSFNKHPGACEGSCGTASSADESMGSPSDGDMFILKRIMVERGAAIVLSGLREKHFGEIFLNASISLGVSPSSEVSNPMSRESPPSDIYHDFQANRSVDQELEDSMSEEMFHKKGRPSRANYEEGLNHIARYVESFESRSKEMWLVFHHEGVSLSKLIYTTEEVVSSADEGGDEHMKNFQILHPSKWWRWLKTTEAGQEEMQNLIQQLLMALKSCHDRNITHRDIKPENMVICFEDPDSGRCLKGPPRLDKNYQMKMRIIDFGSSLDEFTLKHLYGSVGPSRAEQTYEYTPPEALLNASWYRGPISTTMKYDMWSAGVVILELILGSPNVFQINSKSRALLDRHLEGWNEDLKELAYKLRSLMEMCILVPGVASRSHYRWHSDDQGTVSPVPWRCSEEFFSQQIKSRDPLNIGFPNVWALRLVRELLRWHPDDRLSVDDALQHPYFSLHPPK